jgi:ATP/ADP translocase
MTSNTAYVEQANEDDSDVNDSSFRQRLLRGMYTIFRSRLLMAIFTYNALYASTNVLLSFQRAALVASRNQNSSSSSSTINTTGSGSIGSVNADTSFLANINMASSIAIFALQASGFGAYIAHMCGSRGTLSLMPIIRLLGVIALAYWHHTSNGQPPNLIYFLIVDEFCKVMNLAIAKPVRESLWRGLSNEARYEAKPIVDTLANRWGGGSAAFLVTFVDRTVRAMNTVAKYHQNDSSIEQSALLKDDDNSGPVQIFGFPTILFLCIIISAWWVVVSADLGFIRKNIDIDLKKRQ